MRAKILIGLALCACLASPALAQPSLQQFYDATGKVTTVSPAKPLPVDIIGVTTVDINADAIDVTNLATSAKQDTGNTSAASIDTKLTSTNTKLDTLHTDNATRSTAAKQDTGNTSLSSIDTKLSSQATAAKQDTGNTSAASIDTKLSSQATAALQSSVGATAHADAIAPTPLPPGYSFAHISTATTTTVKSGAGVLHTLSVNNLGTVSSLTIIYDNTAGSGTVISSINTLAGQTSYLYDVAFGTGLTVVTTGTVAPDLTLSYR